MLVDCLQLSVGPNFSATPWHRTMYVSCVLDVCCNWMLHVFHLNVASVVSPGCCICCIGYTRMLQVYVLKCFICFRRMLQVFLSVYCICCNAIHVCCKCMFQMFHLFQTYVASVLSGCCICCSRYTLMLQVYISNISPVYDVCCSKCFIL